MKTQRLLGTLLVSFIFLAPLAGCGASSIAKQAFHEIRGAKSKIFLVTDISEDTLLKYRGLRFSPVTTTVGDKICPRELLRDYDECLGDVSADLRDFYPGGTPGLHISSEILYFQRKGLLSGAECLARVKMHDADDKRLVVDAIVRSESKSFRAGGENALAESNVKAIGKFLTRRKLEEEDDSEE
jgi:hypothetical protein